MGVTIRVLSNKLPTLAATTRSAAGRVFAAQRGSVLADMQRRTPVDTGELRGSETAESTDTSLTVRATAPHAVYVHQGTRRMGARPFMADAITAAAPGVAAALADELRGAWG